MASKDRTTNGFGFQIIEYYFYFALTATKVMTSVAGVRIFPVNEHSVSHYLGHYERIQYEREKEKD